METLSIERGLCHVMFAYDAARSIDLDEAARHIQEASERKTIRHGRRAPGYFEFQAAPLRVNQDSEPLRVGRFLTRPGVDLVLYDFGAVAVNYTISLGGPFDELLPLSEELYDNALLLSDSRKRVDDLMKVIASAATHSNVASVVEDYVIFHIESLSQPFEADRFCTANARQIAGILRAERRPLSDQEVEDAVAPRLSYGLNDVALIDWNATLLVDGEGDDLREVLQFANVELVEVRYLDRKLDRALEKSYEMLAKRRRKLRHYGAELRTVAEMQVDNATLFEGINNALKLLGDQYLARAYRMMSRRVHLDDWDAGILRKLHTLESIYQKMSDQEAARRMEVLEWVVIILIALEIVLGLLPLGIS